MAPKWLLLFSPVKRSMTCMDYLHSLVRKRVYTEDDIEESEFAPVLNFFDLVNIGVGATLGGVGAYIVSGVVAREDAGPGVIFSFLLGFVTSVLAALCYAEFGARIPKIGSAYVFTYVSVGELMAFVIGWSLLIEYALGAASEARGSSGYLDSIFNDTLRTAMEGAMPINVPFLGTYPDFISFSAVAILTVVVASGVKINAMFNNICTSINVVVLFIAVVAGSFKADLKNWSIPQEQVPEGAGVGGFLPYGVSGVFAGAAKCFFAYVGFDAVVSAAEEVKNPTKYIPWAIFCCLLVVFCIYTSLSIIITLMVPYYEQSLTAPLPYAFEVNDLAPVRWIIISISILGFSTSMLGSLFPITRVVYAMGRDGLLFKFLGYVHPRTKTPIIGAIVTGFVSGVMALFLDVSNLLDLAAIATLLAYSAVSVCVLLLRYEKPNMVTEPEISNFCAKFKNRILNIPKKEDPTNQSAVFSKILISIFVICQAIACTFISIFYESLWTLVLGSLIPFIFFCFLILVVLIILAFQPTSIMPDIFMTPYVPWLPAMSIMLNTIIMFQTDAITWIRLGIWLIAGIYFWYGNSHSVEELRERNEK